MSGMRGGAGRLCVMSTTSLLVVLCGHQCTSASEWSVRSHLRCGMFVMYCMQWCMSVSAVL